MVAVSPLKKISIFSGLGNAELALLEHRTSRQRFPPDTLVIEQGDDSDSMFVILSGEVRVFLTDAEGNSVNIDSMKKGDYFGEYALLDGSKRNASVITVKECDFLVISKEQILDTFADNPDTAFSLVGDLVTRIRELSTNVKGLREMEVQGRLAGVLLNLPADSDGVRKISLPDLITQVDAPGPIVKNLIRELETAGLTSRKDGQIVLNE